MIDNAVAYYEHLREQGCTPSKAVAHVEQRFGVPRRVVLDRVNGKVADHEATMIALADAKRLLVGTGGAHQLELRDCLASLYEAITGETLS